MSDSDSSVSELEEGGHVLGDGSENKVKISKSTITAAILCFVSVVVQAVTVYLYLDNMKETMGMLVLLACLLNILVAPIPPVLSYKKDKFAGFQDLVDKMKQESDRLGEENKQLTKTIDDMGDSVNDLQDIEGALSSLSGSQESNVQDIVRLVRESKEIAEKQKIVLKGNALQQMVEIVLESFQSSASDKVLDELGTEHLLMGLSIVEGLKLSKDEKKLDKVKREINSTNKELKDILGVVNRLAENSGIGDHL